jgi:hypothetical protein
VTIDRAECLLIMTTRSRRVLIFFIVFIALLGAEAVREKFVYFSATRQLEHAYWKVRPGMTRDQVLAELGQPTSRNLSSGEEIVEWSAAAFRGPLLRAIGSNSGHYTITVNFGQDQKVTDVNSSASYGTG